MNFKRALLTILALFLIAGSVQLGFFLADRMSTPVSALPITYSIDPPSKQDIPLDKVQEASLLIVGDHHAVRLGRYQEQILEKIEDSNVGNFNILNLGHPREGLHRTLKRLKDLKTIPRIIVYMGGGEEFYEKKFSIRDYQKILRNILISKDEFKSSLINLVPLLSKVFYQQTNFYRLPSAPIKDPNIYTANNAQMRIEIGLFFYAMEFQELVRLVHSHNSTLIALTTPLKRDLPPRQVCQNTTNEEIEFMQNRIRHKIDLEKSKTVIQTLEKLSETPPGNARSYFLLGLAYKSLGNLKEALVALTKSRAFDCDPSLGHPGMSEVIRSEAQKSGRVILVDFDRILQRLFGRDAIFEDDTFPLKAHYLKIVGHLANTIKEIYRL